MHRIVVTYSSRWITSPPITSLLTPTGRPMHSSSSPVTLLFLIYNGITASRNNHCHHRTGHCLITVTLTVSLYMYTYGESVSTYTAANCPSPGRLRGIRSEHTANGRRVDLGGRVGGGAAGGGAAGGGAAGGGTPHRSRDPRGRWLAREVSLLNQWNGLVVRIGEKRVCWHWIRLAHLVRPALLLGVAARPAAATAPPRAEEAVASSSESNTGPDTTPVIHPDFSEDDGFLGSRGGADKDVEVDSERAKGVIRALRRTSQRLGDGGDDAHGRAYISHLIQSALFENLHAFEIFQYDPGR